MRAVAAVLRQTARRVLDPSVPLVWQRRFVDLTGLLTPAPRGTLRETALLGGRIAERLVSPGVDPGRAVLLLHGGAFITGSPRSHRGLAARLGRAAGAVVHVPDYRRAPEHAYPAALDDVHGAYLALLGSGLDPASVSLVGDSAGGQLALALLQRLRDAGQPLPAAAALISPWTDLTLGDPRVSGCVTDALLPPAWLVQGAAAYAGDADPVLVSPLLGDLSGLPPLLVHVGGEETLLADSLRLADRAEAAGVDVTLQVLDGLWHDPHLLAGLLPAATRAVQEMGEWLRAGTPTRVSLSSACREPRSAPRPRRA